MGTGFSNAHTYGCNFSAELLSRTRSTGQPNACPGGHFLATPVWVILGLPAPPRCSTLLNSAARFARMQMRRAEPPSRSVARVSSLLLSELLRLVPLTWDKICADWRRSASRDPYPERIDCPDVPRVISDNTRNTRRFPNFRSDILLHL